MASANKDVSLVPIAAKTISPSYNKDMSTPASSDGTADGFVEIAAGQCSIQQDGSLKRNATWMDILYHSITAMVGAGVLGLPAAFSHLGWAGGVIFLIFSIWVSWHTYRLLVYMHEVPDLGSKTGGIRRLDRYDQLAEYVWGPKRGKRILLPFQLAVLVGIAITYTVVGGDSFAAFARGISPGGVTSVPKWGFFLVFGGLQVLLSMLPSLHDARLISLLGALMSASYCLIAVVMSATVKPGPDINYNPANVTRTPVERVMGVFNAMTTVLFAYGGHNVALEIQATIPVGGKQLSSVPAMMRGVNVTFVVTGLCYFGVSILGFYAFGTAVGDDVLLAFEHGPQSWVVAMANMMVVVHVAAAYQVYTQPIYSMIEDGIRKARGDADIPVPAQFGLRIVYVLLVTLVALLIPFFGSLMGLVGAVAITPTTFLLPPLLWVMYKQPHKWGADWAINWGLVWVTGALGVLGCAGALYSIVNAWGTFKIFAA